jgi:hypothetical protein
METNMNAAAHAELRKKGQALIEAARAFWEVHRSIGGPRAVVWLSSTDGSLVVFTRAEYRDQILANVRPISEETPLRDPFMVDDGT